MGRPKGSKNKPKVLIEAPVVSVRPRGRPPKDPNRKVWNTALTNKGYDPCPNCDFPEAYGGYCEECGWMEPVIVSGVEWKPTGRKTK